MHNNDQIEEQATQKWQYYSQGILRNYSNKRKQLLHDFWTDYEQLLAQARRQQQKQVKTGAQATPTTQTSAVATTSEYAYLPWVKLMVPHWDELPLTVSYRWWQQPSIIHQIVSGIGTILFITLGLIALLTLILLLTLGIHWQLVTVELGAWVIAIVLLFIPLPEIPADEHVFQFQADFLLYEKRTIYTEGTKPDKTSFVKIPYDTIGNIASDIEGVKVRPFSDKKWVDQHNKRFRRLVFDPGILASNQIRSFIRDVIKTNYNDRNRNYKP
jgi:hypothetical protein